MIHIYAVIRKVKLFFLILGKYMYFYSDWFWENIFYNIILTKFLHLLLVIVTYLYVTEFCKICAYNKTKKNSTYFVNI